MAELVFYDLFIDLCNKNGISPYKFSQDTSIGQSTISMWKKKSATPSSDKLQKIADYFNVSIDYLLTGEQKESPPSISDEELEGLSVAFYGEAKQSLSEEDKDDIRALIEAKLKRNRKHGHNPR